MGNGAITTSSAGQETQQRAERLVGILRSHPEGVQRLVLEGAMCAAEELLAASENHPEGTRGSSCGDDAIPDLLKEKKLESQPEEEGHEEQEEAGDDPGRFPEDPEPHPDKGPEGRVELTDEQIRKQGELKLAAFEALESADLHTALEKFTEAIKIGNVSAIIYAKRAEILLKLKRPRACIADCDAALAIVPESAKAYKIRGTAHRKLGEWEKAHQDLTTGQTLEIDHDLVDVQKFVDHKVEQLKKRRMKKLGELAEGFIQVSEFQPGGQKAVKIKATEDRAITVSQLEVLLAYIEGHCEKEGWTSSNPATHRQQLTHKTINLYDVVFWVIRPVTKKDNCSFVELIATAAQEPTWFVSHWWGEPVQQFVACLRGHTRDRKLPPTVCYWVCAYANNQWQAGAEVGEDPAQSSFRRAIDKSVGTVTILDESATTYTRIWCSYEIFVTVVLAKGDKEYLYDVYAVISDGSDAVGLTDGLAEVDRGYALHKSHRESKFPIQLIQKGLDSNIVEAQASLEADRVHILNAVVGHSLNETPPVRHDAYDDLNSNLWAFFAARSLKSVAQEDVAGKCKSAMRNSRMREMNLDLSDAKYDNLVLGVVHSGLPDSLRSLSIQWIQSKLGPALGTCIAAAIRDLKGLTTLALNLYKSDIGAEGGIALGDALGNVRRLEKLEVNVRQCGIGDAGALSIFSSLGRSEALTELSLKLENNALDAEIVPSMALAMRAMPFLQKVSLHLNGNNLGDVGKHAVEELRKELAERPQTPSVSVHIQV